MRYFATILSVMLVGCGAIPAGPSTVETSSPSFPVPHVNGDPIIPIANPFGATNLPIIAIWMDSAGYKLEKNSPYLRVAVWDDGRVVFARDPNIWNHDLMLGQLSEQTLAALKQNIRQTGVFKLKGNCYLVPDAPVDCIMLYFGSAQQMLYWDERETKSYGINCNPTPLHLAFKKAWWSVNKLVLAAIPERAKKLDVRFLPPPKEWYLKRKIESE